MTLTRDNTAGVDYDNSTSGLTATDAKAALDELASEKVDKASNLSDVANASTAFDNIKQTASETATGVVERATQAEVNTGTDISRYITPATLSSFSGLGGTTSSNATNGWWQDSNTGIIVQWGVTGNITNDTDAWAASPTAFPKAFSTCYMVSGSLTSTDSTGAPATDPYLATRNSGTTSFQYRTNALSGNNQISFIAIGV